jgi:hypothetical protein
MQRPERRSLDFSTKKSSLRTQSACDKACRSEKQPLWLIFVTTPRSGGGFVSSRTCKRTSRRLVTGFLEIDETYFRESQKDSRTLTRLARKYGGKAKGSGRFSKDWVLALVGRARGLPQTMDHGQRHFALGAKFHHLGNAGLLAGGRIGKPCLGNEQFTLDQGGDHISGHGGKDADLAVVGFAQAPVPLRATPADISPFLAKALSSMIRAHA